MALSKADLQLAQRQGLTLKYIIRLLEGISNFKLESKQYLLDWIFQGNQNPPDTSPNEIKDLLKLILLWDRWCKLKPHIERLPTIERKIQSGEVSYRDTYALGEIIEGANPDLPSLTPESEDGSLPRNLIEIIVTNSFKEIYQEALGLYHPAYLVIFKREFEELLKNVQNKQNTDIWCEKLENLLKNVSEVVKPPLFPFRKEVEKSPEIAASYAKIYYEIWLLIIEFKNLKIKSELLEIGAFITYLETIQENTEMINQAKNYVTQKLTQSINSINEYLKDRLFGNNWTFRDVFLDLLKFLENPNRDRLKQKLQETDGLLDEISGLLNAILGIISSDNFNLGTKIKEDIKKLNEEINRLKVIIDSTISNVASSDESSAAYTKSNLSNRANPNGLRAKLSRLFLLGKK